MKKPTFSREAKLLLIFAGPTVKSLVQWLYDNLNEHESLDIFEWINHHWYIEVNDNRIKDYPHYTLLGLTVHLTDDVIFWSGDQRYAHEGKTNGGNCFCRSERWMRKLRKQFPDVTTTRTCPNGQVRDYRERKPRRKSCHTSEPKSI